MSEIGTYLKQHEQNVIPLYKDYNVKYWELSLAGNNQELERALVAAKERYLRVYNNREEFRQLQEWKAASNALTPEETRQFKLVYDSFIPNQIEEAILREIVEKETQIENLFNTFRADFEYNYMWYSFTHQKTNKKDIDLGKLFLIIYYYYNTFNNEYILSQIKIIPHYQIS